MKRRLTADSSWSMSMQNFKLTERTDSEVELYCGYSCWARAVTSLLYASYSPRKLLIDLASKQGRRGWKREVGTKFGRFDNCNATRLKQNVFQNRQWLRWNCCVLFPWTEDEVLHGSRTEGKWSLGQLRWQEVFLCLCLKLLSGDDHGVFPFYKNDEDPSVNAKYRVLRKTVPIWIVYISPKSNLLIVS